MKKFAIFLLILAMIMNLGLVSFATTSEIDEDVEKYQMNGSRSTTTGKVEKIEVENIKFDTKLLDENFEKNFELGVKRDEVVEDIINKYIKGESKASSVFKNDKIESMFNIIIILDSNKVTIDEKHKLTNYIFKYAPYSDNDNLIKYYNNMQSNTKRNIALVRSSYSPTNAVTYAHDWYNTFNTSSYLNVTALGGDCANFVSQCLVAGGAATDTEWYITKLNSNNPSPQTVADLDASWELADPSPWISAAEFNTYWSNRADLTDEFSGQYVYDNASTVYSKPYHKGDAVQILKKKYWWYEGYYTMIITAYDSSNSDYLLSYHTSATKDKSLNTIANSYKDSKWKFKFFAVN